MKGVIAKLLMISGAVVNGVELQAQSAAQNQCAAKGWYSGRRCDKDDLIDLIAIGRYEDIDRSSAKTNAEPDPENIIVGSTWNG